MYRGADVAFTYFSVIYCHPIRIGGIYLTNSCWRQSSSPLQRREVGLRLFIGLRWSNAPSHQRSVRGYLQNVYGNRVIRRLGYPTFAHGRIEWSPYTPLDLNPCDFFLWGYIKDHCYSENPTTEK